MGTGSARLGCAETSLAKGGSVMATIQEPEREEFAPDKHLKPDQQSFRQRDLTVHRRETTSSHCWVTRRRELQRLDW